MTEDSSPNQARDRLIDLLNTDPSCSVGEDVINQLSDEERLEFEDARNALQILANAIPPSGDQRDFDRSAVETRAMHKEASKHDLPACGFVSPGIQNLGHYQVLETLGHGGFGIVVKARDTKLGRIAALKIPKLDSLLQGQESRDRFAREARLVARLGHPAIVPVYETGSEGPFLFIATAYCNGGNLAQWFSSQDKNIAPELSAKIVARLAEAVQHAHSRSVVHRDIKPSNILLDHGDESSIRDDRSVVDALRVADFGLAKFLSEDQVATRTGATIGTPAYMSPEQARGATDEIGPASDIYSLGAMLYELLSGKPPIVGQSNMATMRAIETETAVSPRRQNPAIPRDLEAICLKCLAKNPNDRYDSAQLLEDDLRRFLRGEPVQARAIGRLLRINRWSRRNPMIATAVTVAFASLAIGMVASLAFGIRANRATKLALENQRLAEEKSAEALLQARHARAAVDGLQRAIANEPKLRGDGFEKFKVNLAAAASDYYKLVSIQQPSDPDVLKEYIHTLNGLAYLLQLVGQHDDAIVVWNRSSEIMQREFPDDLVGWAEIRSKLAEDLLITGKTGDAVEITNDLVSRLESASQAAGCFELLENLVVQSVNAAQNLGHQGDLVQAEILVDDAIEMVNLLTAKSPDDWPTDRKWARVLRSKTETANALKKHGDVEAYAALGIDAYGRLKESHPDRVSEALDSLASIHQALGMSKVDRGLFDEAFTEFEKEKHAMQELMRRHPDVAGLSFNWSNHIHRYSSALLHAGQVKEADQMMSPHLEWLGERQSEFPQLAHLLRITEIECRGLMAEIDERQNRLDQSMTQLEKA